MSIRIASWNLEQRLSDGMSRGDRGTPEKILDRIEELDADIVVLPDAFRNAPAEDVDKRLKELGYVWQDVAYNDADRPEQATDNAMPYMRILSRLAIISSTELRWADLRTMLAITVQDPETNEEIEIIGTHLNDRKSSFRLQQGKAAAEYVNRNAKKKIMTGDWNETHGSGWRARIFGSKVMQFLARHIPSKHELSDEVTYDDLRGFTMRSTDMVSGALPIIEEETNLRDLDQKHRATATPKIRGLEWLPSIRLLQLDHMHASSDIDAEPIRIGRDHGSDHRDISTVLHFPAV
jgi:endonuclease/exonuclease/phosphatase (EEP) superfamily protein YafD